MLPLFPLSHSRVTAQGSSEKNTHNHLVTSTSGTAHTQRAITCSNKLLAPLTLCVLTVLAGCTNDTKNTSRVIEQNTETKTDTKKTTVSYKTTVNTPANGASIEMYDVINGAALGTGKLTTSKPKDTKKPTVEEQGLAANIDIEKDKIKDNTLVLTTVSAPSSGKATYFDPLLNKPVPFPADIKLMTLSSSTNAVATPLTTLALYRTMARLGWFFKTGNESKLPTSEDIKTFLKTHNKANIQAQFNYATLEVSDSLTIRILPSITSQADIGNIANNSSGVDASLTGWLFMLAHLEIYTEQTDSNKSSPYLHFAKDLAKDFLDGDIDKQTYPGLGPVKISLTNFKDNTDPNAASNKDIYLNQFSVLNSYEAKLREKVTNLSVKLNIQDKNNTKAIIKRLDNTDQPFVVSTETTTKGTAPASLSTSNEVRVIPGNDSVSKMTVTFLGLNGEKLKQTVVKSKVKDKEGKEKDVWAAEPDKINNVELDTNTGKVTISSSVIKESTELVAENYDSKGKLIGSLTFFANNNNTLLTYTDFNRPSSINNIYYGIGNKTRPFGLASDTVTKLSINADVYAKDSTGNSLSTDLGSLIGKYQGNGCDLVIGAFGQVTLTIKGKPYTTLIDRELGDSIATINSTGFMLNVSSKNAQTSERRFIQVQTLGQKPVRASTAIADSANASPLSNPDAICTFS